MPSTSAAQHNLMEARAHGATFAKAEAIPVSVAKDFVAADKKQGFSHRDRAKTAKGRKTAPGKMYPSASGE